MNIFKNINGLVILVLLFSTGPLANQKSGSMRMCESAKIADTYHRNGIIVAGTQKEEVNEDHSTVAVAIADNLAPLAPLAPGISIDPLTGLTTGEDGRTDQFDIVLTEAPTATVTIGLSSSMPSEGTVDLASVVFEIGNWDLPQTVTVTGVDDFVDDGDVAYSIMTAAAVSMDPGYHGLDAEDVSVTNEDDDSAGIVVVPTLGLVTNESGTSDQFTIVLASQPTSGVTIGLSSSDPTEGSVSPASVAFTTDNWDDPQVVTVTGEDDFVVDGPVGYTIVTAAATSGDGTYNGMNAADVGVTNQDNDSAGIDVSPTTGLVTSEAGGADQFTIVLTSQPTSGVTIGLSSSDPTEGSVSPSSVVFTTSDWDDPQVVTVTGEDDFVVDGPVGYTIVTAAATSGDGTYNGMNAADVGVTNQDNDSAGIVVSPIAGLVTTEAGGSDQFTIVLASQPTSGVSIGLSSSDPTEGSVSPASVAFTTGNWDDPQVVTVTGEDDFVVDGPVGYTVVTDPAVSFDPNFDGINADDVSVTNEDDDTAEVVVAPTAGLVTHEDGTTDQFTIVLTSQPTSAVIIELSSSDPSEGDVSAASVAFNINNWDDPQAVSVIGVDDFEDDGDISYTIITAPAISFDPAFSGVNGDDVSVTNLDDDEAGVTIFPTSGLQTTETGVTALFTVVLDSQPTSGVSIGLSSSDPTEGSVSPASVAFTTGNWDEPQVVTVTGVDDFVVDGAVPYTIVTAPAVSADPGYSGINPADVLLENLDNDSAGVYVNPIVGLETSEAGLFAEFTIELLSQPSSGVSISLMSSDTTEGTVAPQEVSFTIGNWADPQIVTVSGVDDIEDDGDIVYTIITSNVVSMDPEYSDLEVEDVTLTNIDNEDIPDAVDDYYEIDEDEILVVLSPGILLNDTDPSNDPLTASLLSGVVNGSLELLPSGSFTYTPTLNYFGSDTFQYVASDGTYTDTAVVQISINSVNDIPVAVDDTFITSATHEEPFLVPAPGVLSNDEDVDSISALTASLITLPLNGEIDFRTTGAFTYTPDVSFNGIDSFSYRISDGESDSNTAVVSMTIDSIPPNPVEWVFPVGNQEIYHVNGEILDLEILLDPNDLDVDRVHFYRWDAVIEDFVDIGMDYEPPYQVSLDTSTLNFEWNQVFAVAYDHAGNSSTREFVWFYYNFQPRAYLPMVYFSSQ